MGDASRQRQRPAGMSVEQIEAANRARLRRDYEQLTPAQRVEQVIELSRQLASMASAKK